MSVAAVNPVTTTLPPHARTYGGGGVNGPVGAGGRRATGVDDKFNAIFTDARARVPCVVVSCVLYSSSCTQ